ncbi:MAG TPA: disulfide bond formation protein B [Caulobacteraceae bacterium]
MRHWPWTALVVSLAILGIAHGFETFGRLAPCELCLKERQVYWAAAGLALVGGLLSLRVARLRLWTCVLLALVFLGGALLAGYHAGVEWKFWPGPEACTGSHIRITVADMQRLLNGAAMNIPRCDKPAFVFLGISMAGWNAVVSLVLAVLSVAAARLTYRRAEF